MNNGKGCVTPKQKEKFDRREATKEAKYSMYDKMEFRLVDKANYYAQDIYYQNFYRLNHFLYNIKLSLFLMSCVLIR